MIIWESYVFNSFILMIISAGKSLVIVKKFGSGDIT